MVIIIIFIHYTINGTERIYEFQIACQTRAYTGLAEAYLLDICVFVMQDTQEFGEWPYDLLYTKLMYLLLLW
jgi:hypothetical protein